MDTKEKIRLSPKHFILPAFLLLPLLLVGLFELLKGSTDLMSAWVFGCMAPLERSLGRLWSIFPFSVAELLTALFLLFCAIYLVRAAVLFIKKKARLPLLRRLAALVAAWLWLWAGLCWLWNAAYYVPSFALREGLSTAPYDTACLTAVTEYFAENAARLSAQVQRDEDGHFAEDISACFRRGPEVYQNIAAEFPSLGIHSVRAKPLLCSRLQSILGFTGVYFPFTGEANVNIDAPACLTPSVIAHEMAHQRMVASELEANFVGIAACTSSDDVVFQYSGYLSGLINLSNALYPVAPEAWNSIVQEHFTPELATDWNDNHAYWAALESPIDDAAGQVYDSFLKGNDQELGLRSYGACVDLLVNYFYRQKTPD